MAPPATQSATAGAPGTLGTKPPPDASPAPRTRWRALAEDPETQQLVLRFALAQRDARAADASLERLLTLSRPVAESIARRYTASGADVADITQETLVYLAHHLQDLRDPAAFPYWLARIAQSAALQWLRRERRHREGETRDRLRRDDEALVDAIAGLPEVGDPHAASAAAAIEDRDQVLRLLRLLPAREREAVRRVYLDDQPQLYAARRMGLGQKAIENLLYRAVRRLRLITRQCAEDYQDLVLSCTRCGRHPVSARLQPGDGPRYPLRLRATCPLCFARNTPGPPARGDWAYIGLPLADYPMLEDALLRGMGELAGDVQHLVRSPRCDACGQPMAARHGDDLSGYLYWECRRCGLSTSSDVQAVATAAAEWRAFWRGNPRMRHGESRVAHHDGERQIVVTAWDPTSDRAATAALAHATLEVRSVEVRSVEVTARRGGEHR